MTGQAGGQKEQPMAQPLDLTGQWVGSYGQHGRQHPIRAELTQEGEHLTGTMHDEVTDFETSVFEAAADAGLPPGMDEQIEARLRELFPEVVRAPVRSAMRLPPTSILKGRLRGQVVTFAKTYQGEHFSGFRVGEKEVGQVVEEHVVQYQGQVDDKGLVLEGGWWIDPIPGLGGRRTEGLFTLRRA